MEIPVVFATDEKYLFYTIVAITSMAENAKEDTFYHIYIMVSGQLEKGHPIMDDVQKKYSNIMITLMPVDGYLFQKVHINNSHVTQATFYRLLLGELLHEDKCLYLDSDIIVNEDLQELFATGINSEYIAGVRDLWIDFLSEEDRENRRRRTGIPSMDQYVNAGVLLLNLDKIRKDHMTERFRSHLEIDYLYEDQDILNVCCYGYIKRLPAKWNLFTLFMGKLDEMEKRGIDKGTIEQMKKRNGIIHYATPFLRPWKFECFLCNDIWWRYASVWSGTSQYQKLRKEMVQREIGYSEKKMANYCMNYERVYIWGFTVLGRKLFCALMENGVKNITGFIDNDAEKQKFTYCDRKVMPMEAVIHLEEEKAILIASQNSGGEIRSLLLHEGIREEDIILYRLKDVRYDQNLRPEFRDEEGFYA